MPPSDAVPADDPTVAAARYRGSSYDEALALATAELGPEIVVVEANRIRRGGLGGFFATDLGVEVAVRPATEAPTVGLPPARPQPELPGGSALERLLAQADARERAARPHDFAALLANELVAAVPTGATATTEEWSAEAYRRLAIPTPATPGPDAAAADPLPPRRPPTTAPAVGVASEPRPPTRRATRNAADGASATLPTASTATDANAPAKPRRGARPKAAAGPAASKPVEGAAAQPADGVADTIELVSRAGAELLRQLATTPVEAGSRLAGLRSLTVSVTSPDGRVVEIKADLEGDRP